jgi:predicted DsbA family dithiol-disulfide isomerase
VEVERLEREYDVRVRFAPFLLDPTVPPEGKERRRYTAPDSPQTPIEERGERLGIGFARGRERTSYSIPALQAAEFASDHGEGHAFHKEMFKAYFEDLADISQTETILDAAKAAALDPDAMRRALDTGEYTERVNEGIAWSRAAGVSGIPTFIFEGKYGLVGAQEYDVFQSFMARLGKEPKA